MDYTIKQLAELSGVTTRTLRYYDEIGLLKPRRVDQNQYRIYGQEDVDMLQQILFYRELGIGLEEIGQIIQSPNFQREEALQSHLICLQKRKQEIESLIDTVSKTIRAIKGEIVMKDQEKFEGFKQKIIQENEANYGKEVRSKYGDESVDASNAKVASMSEEQWKKQEQVQDEMFTYLKQAMSEQSPCGEAAMKACELHKEWLCMFWKDGMYNKQAHLGMAQMYVSDERFREYYDSRVGEGATQFLLEALREFTK